jgi:hypothetical protein
MGLPDLLTLFPLWLIGLALGAVVVLLAYMVLIQGRTLKTAWFEVGGRNEAEFAAPSTRPSAATKNARADARPQPVPLRPVADGQIGRNLQIGGLMDLTALQVMASDWHRCRDGSDVCSGYLYSLEPDGPACPQVFFKVHTFPNGLAHIHIASMAAPVHLMWLYAPGQPRQTWPMYYLHRDEEPKATPFVFGKFRWK